jgi:hypothetical protein
MNIIFSTQPSLIPVLRALAPKHQLYTLHAQFTKLCEDSGIAAPFVASLATAATQRDATALASKAHSELYALRPQHEALPVAMNTWLANGGLAEYFYPRLSDLAMAIQSVELAKPDLLVLHNDVEPLHRLLALWAKAHSVPVLHVPHAIYLETEERGPAGSDVHDLVTATHLAAAGPFQAQWYRERSPDLAIYVTGLPQFDRFAKPRTIDRARAAKLLHLDPAIPTMVYMSSWRQDTNLLGCHSGVEDTYTAFLKAYQQLPDMQLIVKCHPRGNNVEWHAKTAESLGIACAVTAEHLDPVLTVADLVFSYGPSNVVLEAATMRKLKLLVSSGFPSDPEIIVAGEEVETILAGITKAFLSPLPDYTRLLDKYLGPWDGQAYQRIANLIEIIGA